MSDDERFARAVRTAFGAGVRVQASRALAGDASTRRYVRLQLAGGGAPDTIVAMVLGEGRFAPGSDELGGGISIDELPFLNVGRWLAARGFSVPAVYHDGTRDDALLLLEDVGDETLWTAASRGAATPLFERAVDLLVELQAAGHRWPDPACYAFRRVFDGPLARREVEHFVDHGIRRPLDAAARARVLADLEPLLEPFASPRRMLVHRDFMAWNLHVRDGALRLIDFQDALLGPDTYDLASLLTDRSTATAIGPSLEDALIARFVDRRSAAGLPVEDDLPRRYALVGLHRALKVIGRFHFLADTRGKRAYLDYLPDVVATARRMFARLPALAAAQRRLGALIPELAPSA
jgi:aminoglycoside/choline kinase family phosphotransferase